MERKFKKNVGIDSNLARKERELKNSKIQKEKRTIKANKHRKIGEPASDCNLPKRVLQHMKEKVSALLSDDARGLEDAAVYFRKVLAVDRYPPIDEIIDAGILPRMIELLHIAPTGVVFEIAWCITNIACGEPHHTKALVSCGALPILTQLLCSSADKVREQALWALVNIAAQSGHCKQQILDLGICHSLLQLLNITDEHVLSGVYSTTIEMYSEGRVFPSPSLFTMQYAAWMCANLVRDKHLPNAGDLIAIISIASLLLQSPDDTIIASVCTTLATVCGSGNYDMVEQLLKQGIMHKLIDICVQTPSNRWAAVGVLCAVIKSENPLHKCVALRKNYTTPAIDLLLLELGDSSAEGEQQDIIPENETTIQICSAISVVLLEGNGSSYADAMALKNLHVVLAGVLRKNQFETFVVAGRCLCYLLLNTSPVVMIEVVEQVYPAVMLEILRTNDMQLLVIALSCTMQALETLNSADTSDNTRALSILVTLACDDEFYNVIGVIMENGNVDATRDIALEILVLLDRVRSIHGE